MPRRRNKHHEHVRLLEHVTVRDGDIVREQVNLRDHPCYSDNPSTDEQHQFLRELIALRRDPDALQDTGFDRVQRLWALEWSRKSVAKVTGLSVKALRTLQRKGQAKQRARAPMRTRLSNNTLRGIANVHAIPRTRSKHLVQTFPHPAGTWMRRPCEQKALRWLTALQDPQVPQPLHKAIQQMPLEDIKILYRTCKMIAPICLEYISAEPELILHGASSGSLDFGTAHQTNPTTPNADYED
jgi:hypothetical protein